ncbi:ArnT family glycosyltransferase [Frateuria defendens]|uniref:ArnT family glycosyltransferase n=1 Tax=Frateuria defendens TaxID=2219559 RepID=UPI00066FB38B|nr:glycosyltransferase family 39 protein [Frateuria defendens]
MHAGRGTCAWRWLLAVLLLLPPVFFMLPIPIDETRYLAVAWNMHLGGQWLVPWLDGAPYSDKPPLLFWLIDLTWALTGVHAWAARLLELLLALATLPLLALLGRRLGASAEAVRCARWLWLGSVALAGFAGGVMFDALLVVCTLVAWLGALALLRGQGPAGVAVLGLGLGLAVLAKGPVGLLVGGLPALLAPWWQPPLRTPWRRYYLAVAVALAAAAVLVLAWALPAARAGGEAYANAIFLRQTVGRMAGSFAHARGWWWYLPVAPLLLLPWTLALGRGGVARAALSPLDRFALAASVPAFLAFCLISGKQPHYLLPLLPGPLLAAGVRLADGRWRVVGWRVGLVLLAFPVGFAVVLRHPLGPVGLAYACVAAMAALGLGFLLRGRRDTPVEAAALGMIAAIGLAKLAFMQALGPGYDVRPAAQRIARAQAAGVPLLHAGQQHGLYTFAGRLTRAIPSAHGQAQVATWAGAHPDGWVISSYPRYRYAAAPLYAQPMLGRRLAIWRAGDIADEAARIAEAKNGTAGDEDDKP